MAKTAEQERADGVLRDAIALHAKVYGNSNDDEILTEFAVIAAWAPMDPSLEGTTHYTSAFHVQKIPMHVAVGLLELGKSLVLEEDYDEGDEG